MRDSNLPSPSISPGRRFKPWLLGLTGLLLGIGSTLLWIQQLKPDAPPPTLASAAAPSMNAGRLPPPMQSGVTHGPAAMLEPRARIVEDISSQFAAYESRFVSDKPDPKWAPIAENSLMEAATDPALAEYGIPRDFDARCIGRMCKVTMTFEAHGQASDWAELYVLGMAGAVSLVQTRLVQTADGRPQLILYGAREGSEVLLAPPPSPTPVPGQGSAPNW